jgi:NitT/TauT family transport system permease protein
MLNEMIIASPRDTFVACAALLSEKTTWLNILMTSQRLLAGLLAGSAVGIVLGLSAGLNARVRLVLEPLRWVAMTIPAVVVAIVAMLWFGMGSSQVIVVAAAFIMPFTYINVREGVLAIDEKIVEMGRSFRLPRRMLLVDIYLPSIGSSLMAALPLTAGMGVRVVVLAELMGAHEGIGHSFSIAWNRLNTPDIFAWILVSLLLLGVLEFGILAPLKHRMLRWKRKDD